MKQKKPGKPQPDKTPPEAPIDVMTPPGVPAVAVPFGPIGGITLCVNRDQAEFRVFGAFGQGADAARAILQLIDWGLGQINQALVEMEKAAAVDEAVAKFKADLEKAQAEKAAAGEQGAKRLGESAA